MNYEEEQGYYNVMICNKKQKLTLLFIVLMNMTVKEQSNKVELISASVVTGMSLLMKKRKESSEN